MPRTKKQPATVFDKTETVALAIENPPAPETTTDTATQVAQDAPVTEPSQDSTPEPTPDPAPPAATEPPLAPKRGRKPKAEIASMPATTPSPRTAPVGGFTMADLAARYIEGLRLAGKGLGTQFSYSIDLAVAVKHFGPETEVASLTTRRVQNYFESDAVLKTRTGRGKAKPGVDKTRRVLRLALVWAAEQGLIPEAPIPESAKPRAKKTDEAA